MTKVHFLGIGGSGTSAAAAIAQAQGYEVTGCDLNPVTEFTTKFKDSQLLTGHDPSHLEGVGILAITPAILSLDPNNPELKEAKDKGIEVLTWQQFTGKYLQKDKFVIAVAGTHGKSTTTAMIAKLLEDAKLDPTVILGAIVPSWEANFRIPKHSVILGSTEQSRSTTPESNKSDSGQARMTNGIFVIEADEYNDNFLSYHPDISVVTNIEMDHPEYFKDLGVVLESFKKFLSQTKSTIVANLSDPGIKEVLSFWGGATATTPESEKKDSGQSSSTALSSSLPKGQNDRRPIIIDFSQHLIDFPLQIPGQFNKLNASAAFQVGLLLGIDSEVIRKSLENYTVIGRRFEYLGDFKGAKVYSDFGHHPTEVKTTMEAAREKFPKQKIWLIYEPHMFTRTKALFDDFVRVFKEISVDKIIITDIYPSRQVDTGLVSSQQLVDTVGDDRLVYHTKEDIGVFLKTQVQPGDIIFFMGAGEIDKMAREFVKNKH